MSARDEIGTLIAGLTEEECQRLLDGVDVYGLGAFGLTIYDFVEAAKPPAPIEVRNGDLFIRSAAEFMDYLRPMDTPILNRLP